MPRHACHFPLEIAPRTLYPEAVPNQTGLRTAQGKAITRDNTASHGIYSVTPILPRVERQAGWLAHRARVFADLAPAATGAENIHAVCIKISPKLPNEFNVSSKRLAFLNPLPGGMARRRWATGDGRVAEPG